MKLIVGMLAAVLVMSALAGCRGEAAVDTDGTASTHVPVGR